MNALRTLAISTTALLLLATPALSHGVKNCTDDTEGKWVSPQQVAKMLSDKGYKVRKVKNKGTCWEAYANKNSQKFEVFINPVTGKIFKVEED